MPRTKDKNKLARERIVAALTELMSEKEYASITITEITQRAKVSRMTYYRNYSSKEDILRKFMSDVGERIHAKIVEHDLHRDAYRYYLTLIETLGKYAAPVTAALTYIQRKLLTQKHIFFCSDFFPACQEEKQTPVIIAVIEFFHNFFD